MKILDGIAFMEKSDYLNNVAIPVKQIFLDVLKYSPSKVSGIIGNTVLIPVYTNLLTPEQYGLYTLSIAVLSFLCIIFSDWVGLSGLRFFRRYEIKDDVPKYLSALIILLVTNITLMFFIAFICRHNFYEFFKIPGKVFAAILILIIPVAFRALLFQILRAQIKPVAFTVSTIVNQILTICLAVFIIKFYNLGALSVLLAMGISISLIDIVLMFQCNIFSYLKLEKLQFSIFSSLYKYGIPLALTSISLWFITQSNKFILQHLNGYIEVGYVGVAYSMTFSILMTLFAVIPIAAVPRIINMYEDGRDVRPVVSTLTGYFMLIGLPVIILMSLYSKELVALLANKNFSGAYVLVPYLAFSAFFLSFAEYTTLQYHLIKKTYIDTVIRLVSGIAGIVLNIILIKKMGLVGLGIATLAGNVLYFLLSVFIVVPGLEWKIPFEKILKIVICFVPVAFLYFIFKKTGLHYGMQIVLLALTYYLGYSFVQTIKPDRLKLW